MTKQVLAGKGKGKGHSSIGWRGQCMINTLT